MFGDLFGSGVTAEHVNAGNQAHEINSLALATVLVDKGIITIDELAKARVQATHVVEQAWARKKEEANKEFDENHPGLRKLFGDLAGHDPSA